MTADEYDFGQLYSVPSAYDLSQVNEMSAADALVWYNRHGIAAHPADP